MKPALRPSGYEPEGVWYEGLDGVRGVAVFLVFTAHYIPQHTFRLGWVGVPVFFVLSGFLITGILYDNVDLPFRFRDFYWRRSLRIFPLFLFVWIVIFVLWACGLVQWKPVDWLWPAYLGNYARLLGGAGVDDLPTKWHLLPLPVNHFWSLAVEEQFYLVWPLVVFNVRKRKPLIWICIAVVLLTPCLRLLAIHRLPAKILELEFLYRATPSHLDAFLLGGLLALLLRSPRGKQVVRYGNLIFWSGAGLCLLAMFLNVGLSWNRFWTLDPWMGEYGFSLINLTSAGFILCAIVRGSHFYRVLTWLPLRTLGKYSYGFYVYHGLFATAAMSVLAKLNQTYPASHGLILCIWLLCSFWVVFFVSMLSFHVLEKPFLRLKSRYRMKHENPDVVSVPE